jgi:hypothetical protein
MNEAELRQLMMMLSPNAANTTYMQPNQEAMLRNQSISPFTPQGGAQMPNQTGMGINELLSALMGAQVGASMPAGQLSNNELEMISSGDPDGMTAPPMQLSPEQIIARQQAYAQQEMLKQQEFLRSQRTGQQLQRGDDSIFDRMLRGQ